MRLPIAWAISAIAFVLLAAVSMAALRPTLGNADGLLADTYYVHAHTHYVVSLCAGYIAITLGYFVIERFDVRVLPVLGYSHLALTIIGAVCLLAPAVALGLTGFPKRYVDYQPAFTFWNQITRLGYGLTITGLIIFAGALIEAMARRAKPRA